MKLQIKAIALSQRTSPATDKYPATTTLELRDLETQAPILIQVPTPLPEGSLFKELLFVFNGVVHRNYSWTDKSGQTRSGNVIKAEALSLQEGGK